jgi:hypothetical protein
MPRDLGTSPEADYFRTPQSVRHTSRWKEDWEELELLVSISFMPFSFNNLFCHQPGQGRIWLCSEGTEQD